jgi:hypothetical protein
MSALGHSLQTHSAHVPINVRSWSVSDHSRHGSELKRRATSFSEGKKVEAVACSIPRDALGVTGKKVKTHTRVRCYRTLVLQLVPPNSGQPGSPFSRQVLTGVGYFRGYAGHHFDRYNAKVFGELIEMLSGECLNISN